MLRVGLDPSRHPLDVRVLHPTRRLAEEAMRARLRTLHEASDPFPSEITVEQFAPTFLERKAPAVRPHTLTRYRSIIERDVIPAIGQVELRKIKPAHLQIVLDAVARTRGRRCVEEAKAVMSGLLKTAASGGLVDTNAARGGMRWGRRRPLFRSEQRLRRRPVGSTGPSRNRREQSSLKMVRS